MTSVEALSAHVVDYDEYWASIIRRGLWCIDCREQFRGFRWPDHQMSILCGCLCICHREPK